MSDSFSPADLARSAFTKLPTSVANALRGSDSPADLARSAFTKLPTSVANVLRGGSNSDSDSTVASKATSVKNPRQAGKVFQPKHRNTFMVRFILNGSDGSGAPKRMASGQNFMPNVSFVAKMVERPKVNLKAEELHQYNKKRQVYTGFKLDPVRMQLYDTVGGTAHKLWSAYTSYYFGDLSRPDKTEEYFYDVTSENFRSTTGNNFGFTGANNGAVDIGAHFFFSQVEIYHFSQTTFDRYTLVHPRIIAYDPDDLDYENSSVAMIGMTLVYERLRFESNIPINRQKEGPHFSDSGGGQHDTVAGFEKGEPFDGEIRTVPNYGHSGAIGYGKRQAEFEHGTPQATIGQLMGRDRGRQHGTASQSRLRTRSAPEAVGALNRPPPWDQRYDGQDSTGSLGTWGDFEFAPRQDDSGWDLESMSLASPQFAAAIDYGAMGDPSYGMSYSNPDAWRGIDGAAYDLALGRVGAAMLSGYGRAPTLLQAGVMAASAILGDSPLGQIASTMINRAVGSPVSGVRLRAASYGAINARQTGTAQYGYNLNTDSDGNSWGYTGPSGYLGPVGPENDGPYLSNQPSGLYGRYGIVPQPNSGLSPLY